MAPSAQPRADQTRQNDWSIHLLGVGLIVYAAFVLYALVGVFPKSAPTRDVVTSLKTIADDRFKAALALDTVVINAKKGNDSVGARRWAALADSAHRVAGQARAYADTVERKMLDPALVPSPLRLFAMDISQDLSPDWRFLILAMLAGAMGAFLHVAQSFSTYVGNREFSPSWTWWYLLRPFMGASLAVVVYVVFRSTLVPGTASVGNAYGVVALAALSGMFSKQAIDKLNEIFIVAFRSAPGQGDAARSDKVAAQPSPILIGTVEPPQPTVQNGTVAFTVRGTGFGPAAVAFIDEVATSTRVTDPTRLEASIADKDLPGPGPSYKLTVRIPPKVGALAGDRGTVSPTVMITLTRP